VPSGNIQRSDALEKIMSECGCGNGATADVLRQTRVLIAVLLINAVMFVVEAAAGIVAHSSALLADSLDMLFLRTSFGVIGRSLAELRRPA
jgi:Co/Zn/Cd efflux system component